MLTGRDHGSGIYLLVPYNQRPVSPNPNHKAARPLDAFDGSSKRSFREGEGAAHDMPRGAYGRESRRAAVMSLATQ